LILKNELMVTNLSGRGDTGDPLRPGMVFNRRTALVEWNDELELRVRRFARKERLGECPPPRQQQQRSSSTSNEEEDAAAKARYAKPRNDY